MAGRKKKLKVNKDSDVTMNINKDDTGTLKEAPEIKAGETNEHVGEAILPDKVEFVEAEVGVDLTKDGKAPIAMVFECGGETVVQAEWEYMDRTKGTNRFDVYPLVLDTMGKELKKSEVKGRALSGLYCIPAKRIISCNAKKIYVIY